MRKTPLQLMKYRVLYFLISAVCIVPGLILLITQGLLPAIDFTGGTFLEIKINNYSQDASQVVTTLSQDYFDAATVQTAEEGAYVIRSKEAGKDVSQAFQNALLAELNQVEASETAFLEASISAQVEELRFETVGPTLGKELLEKTIVAVVLATLAILSYIAWRFQNFSYGICAVVAMLHDTLFVLGSFAILGYFFQVEVDTLFVTAVLTTLSFSVHDTIVMYDRIRELRGKFVKSDFEHLVNRAVTETLSRSINNSMTIIFMLLALWLFGGASISWFVFALLLGTIAGTYSSAFTAAPLLVVWNRIATKTATKK